MAGETDYMLRVVVTDMQAYDQFYKTLIARFALKNVTSQFAMERLKQTTALPIPARPLDAAAQPRAEHGIFCRASPGEPPSPIYRSFKRTFRLTKRTSRTRLQGVGSIRPRDLLEQLALRHQG